VADDLPVARFESDRARVYRPSPKFAKTAILVDVADPAAVTTLRTSFGEQHMRGAFYIVANGDDSYGAAQEEFEGSHIALGSNRWLKRGNVLAYRSKDSCVVHTEIDDHNEASVEARPGDWIVRQASGELMVVTEDEFTARYEPTGS
jgi:hypothetical protein